MTLDVLVRDFCEDSRYIKGFTPRTIQRYRTVLRLLAKTSHITELEQATDEVVRKFFFEGRTLRNWSVNTFLTYYKTLSVFFDWCIRNKHCLTSPTRDIQLPKLPKRLPPKLTKQQALRLLEVVYNYPYPHSFLRHRNHAVFAVFIFAGLRRQEVLNLQLSDADVDNLTLFVRQGKGSKDRIIPMCRALAEILRAYVNERRKLGKTCPELFTSLASNRGLPDITLRKLIAIIRRASGIAFTAHMLRHTFATLMLEGGCDIYSLSKMMGHSDISTTTIYLAASAEHLRSQMTKHPLNETGAVVQLSRLD